jgi:APA family basic amino acid/polyamine antiporter
LGLVIGNAVGVGVLTSTGYMAEKLSPAAILAGWALGGVSAMAGARAYAALAEMNPRSGGEYRYLSDLLHPAVGYLAGWTSMLAGFAAALAVAGMTAGSFAETLLPWLPARAVGAAMIVALTALHAFDLTLSKWGQNLLAGAKVVLLGGFVAVGLFAGSNQWPTWRPAGGGGPFPLEYFMISQVYIAYAYSGWNAAAYASGEFRDPRRNVPRALVLGTLLVCLFYLAVNWVFVANLSGERLAGWSAGDTSRITLGHLLVQKLAGPAAAHAMSVVVILSLFSSMSSMTMVGPRVYRAMALEGYLPRAFAGQDDRPPLGSVLLQSGVALLLLLTHSFELLMRNAGAILTLVSGLTVLTLFRVQLGRTRFPKPGPVPLVAAAIYVALAGWMLWFAVSNSPSTVGWIGGTAAIATGAWFATRSQRSV